MVDADDLAELITKLHFGKVHVVGHSYGAFTALFLATRHPALVRTLVLAEAPAVSLLTHLPGERSEIGRRTFADIQERMVKPMKVAFQKGDREAGLRAFIDFVLDDPHAWNKMPDAARQDMLNHAHEWDVMMTRGELFPELDPQAVRNTTATVLLLSGQKSYGFLGLIDEELERLLPHNRRIVLQGATHRMWFEQPEVCRKAVLDFWREQEVSHSRPVPLAETGNEVLHSRGMANCDGNRGGSHEWSNEFRGGGAGGGRNFDGERDVFAGDDPTYKKGDQTTGWAGAGAV